MLPRNAPTRADALLAIIGVSLVVAILAASVAALPFAIGVGVAFAIAGAALVDGMVVNPPSDG